MFAKLYSLIIGKPRDPMDKKTRKHIALTAFLAWIGLGADGLSSSCYGPQESFLALGHHTQLALYLAVATAITVFLISFAYNQVIELFPNGGGGYKAATKLLGPNAGLLAGSALIVDYILTISISIASGTDALFSMLPLSAQVYKIKVDVLFIIILMILNLRGMKESIKILMPIFIGFVITHLFMILYGIFSHSSGLPVIAHQAIKETHHLALLNGAFFVVALFLSAYSIGGGTYTGLEAVSNNVNILTKPRVKTGKWTMFYMAVSLSITAGGIILLYLLWHAKAVAGETLNAVVFTKILHGMPFAHSILIVTLIFEFGLLFVGANTGFLGGPAVVANMAMDNWMPNKFRILSSRLVTQNGVILFGIAAIILVTITHGHVGILVVLYSINVFLAFITSIAGLCKHWYTQRGKHRLWLQRLILSSLGFIVCGVILTFVVVSRFFDGGWEALLVVACVMATCVFIRKHYSEVYKKLDTVDEIFAEEKEILEDNISKIKFDNNAPTAVFFVSQSRGAGMHTLLWVQRLFPDYFKNFIFLSCGVIDVESYGAETALDSMKKKVKKNLDHFVRFARKHNYPVRSYVLYGIDPVEELGKASEKIYKKIPNAMFFASELVMEKDNWFVRQLHNETAFAIQRKLHLQGMRMVILPMKLN